MKRLLIALLVGALFLTACEGGKEGTTKKDKKATEQALKKVKAKVGFPQVEDSLELRNLKRRYETLDDVNKIGYVYLISFGRIFAEYTVKGKVSSLNSQFTNPLQESGPRESRVTIAQAEPDGSFGENPEGIFFFTSDGVYVEWAGDYQYSDERLELRQPEDHILTKPTK